MSNFVRTATAVLVASFLFVGSTAQAAVTIALNNPSFESPSLPSGPYSFNWGSGAIPGWTDATPDNNLGGIQNIGPVGASTEVEFPNPLGGAPDGTNAAWLWGGVATGPGGPFPLSTAITQTTAVTVLPGVTYTLQGFYGQPLVAGGLQLPQALSTISILQGGVPIGVFASTGPSVFLGPFTVSAVGQPGGGLLGVELRTTDNYSYFDTIHLESNQVVPEPASVLVWSFIGALSLAVGTWWRRSAC